MLRLWVYKALLAVVEQNAYSNLYLKNHLHELPAKDRALATRIFYGTLQNWQFCQAVWSRYASKKPSKKAAVLLTMSVYQLLFLDKVPAYAIINDANNIAKKEMKSSAGFINAVLRKVNREDIVYPQDEIEKAAFVHSLPLWLVKMWQAQYGKEKALQMAQYSNQSLPVTVRRNPLAISKEDFEKDESIQPGEVLDLYTGTAIFEHPFYTDGKMSAQDEGSYLIAQMLDPKPGQEILDVCAAPGTKTMAMAEMMENQGAITALDLHEHRVQLIENDAKRLHLDIVKAMAKDSTDLSGLGLFDKVLCDVPCSGYGVLSRKPDIKLKMDSSDMDTLIPVQKQLLAQAAMHVKPGGELVYSTCTVNKKENEKRVEGFLKDRPDFILKDQKTIFIDEGMDGFYMALLERKA